MEKDISYQIVQSMRVAANYIQTGHFILINDKEAAVSLFARLEGRRHVSDVAMLTLELREQNAGREVVLGLLECTLSEMTDNCRMITLETFRLLNLE